MANYTIIGDDGKEYGPVSAEEVRKWIADGRAGSHTKVRAEGTTEWQPLSQVPELADALKRTSPPPLSGKPVSPASKLSALAVISLVLGVFGLPTCGVTALFGLIFGIIALVRVSNSRGALRGKGLALVGTILSGICLLIIPILVAMLLPALASAHDKAREINCKNNEKQLVLAVKTYSDSNAGHFPPAATWCDAIKGSVSSDKVFKCPAANATNRCDYAYNAKLDGMDASKVDPQTVVIFESDAGWDAHGGPELESPRHKRNLLIVAFADGHVEAIPPERLNSLRWNP
jgi:prepilin-type processing-associated H-X9-DG protein